MLSPGRGGRGGGRGGGHGGRSGRARDNRVQGGMLYVYCRSHYILLDHDCLTISY